MRTVLIVGSGDVAKRAIPWLARRFRVIAVVRRMESAAALRALGARVLQADLDQPSSLARLAGLGGRVLHLAPPPASGEGDPRTRSLLAALCRRQKSGRSLLHVPRSGLKTHALRTFPRQPERAQRIPNRPPKKAQKQAQKQALKHPLKRHVKRYQKRPPMVSQRLVYISTSGVYGDCGGDWVAETRPPSPQSARGRRRLAAEQALRRFGQSDGRRVSLLRAPGIYAADRLPLQRLRRGDPALRAEEDVFTNHIHADDLARLACLALFRGRPNRVYNASDASPLRMGDWFDTVASRFGLPPPPRVSWAEAQRVLSAPLLSFFAESRRLDNRRILRELSVRLLFPEVTAGLADAQRQLTESPQGLPPC